MIGWEDVWKVVVAIAPLYAALMLGYSSVRWWRIFTPQECEAINHLVCYFTYPLFMFEFAAHVDPSRTNYLFVGADVLSKAIIAAALACWARWRGGGAACCWSVTAFSLTTLTNSLVVGVPLLKAMYGPMAVDLVVQSSILQALVWLSVLLFVLEVRRTRDGGHDEEAAGAGAGGAINSRLMKQVGIKLAKNPNSYASVLGVTWAFLSNRWHFGMPSIMEGSIVIMSRAGIGTTMFSMGLFMALQEKVIACGASLTILGMALKFVAGPLAMALASAAVGLHGDVLRLAIIQAALPQSITSFIFAKEYELHADVLSTAVIFGMLVSLPVLIGYYAILEFVQ